MTKMAGMYRVMHRTRGAGVLLMLVVMMGGYVRGMNVIEVKPREGLDGQGVALMWGIADTTASVGRLFRYHIPGDAFKGPVDKYEVVEVGKATLPSWMEYVSSQHLLQGIPTPAYAGQLYLEVTAHDPLGHNVTDVFSISISPETSTLSSGQPLKFKKSGPEAVRCKREEPETIATIIVDADLDKTIVAKRLTLLNNFLSHMGLEEDMVKMVPALGKLLQDDTALVTGTGDVSEPKFAGVAISWLVGCGKVEKGHFPVLQKLDDDTGSGVMGKVLGHPVVGWRVTNTRLQQQALKRKRRQALATTPVVTLTPQTATGVDSMTRQVVERSSPVFEPSPTEPTMPKTTTPMPATTPKQTGDGLQPSKTPVLPPDHGKTDPLPPATTDKPKKPMPPPVGGDCLKPTVLKDMDRPAFLVGEVIDYTVPDDLLSACGQGGTSMTKLSLFIVNNTQNTPIPKDWFLQFDQRTQTMRGMAMEKDAGTYNMMLVAMLKIHDYITRIPFKIVVRKPKGRKSRVNHKLSMTIDTDYKEFMGSVDKKLDLASKVAGVFGDKDTSSLTVTNISPGSVVYSFTNNSLAGNGCPVEAVTRLADKMVTVDGKINPEALEKLKPWVLTGAATKPAGDCEGNSNFPTRSAVVVKPHIVDGATTTKPDSDASTTKPDVDGKPKGSTAAPNVTGVASAGKTGDGNIWITTVVPAVVIVAILLVALLIACILYRKKRKGKMNLEEQDTFVNKGAPVIFPDELDEKPSDSSKPLLIEGSPPAPPPEYHRGDSDISDPGNDQKEATPPTDEVDAEIEIDATSPLYQPPPPVPASSGKQARPNVQQPYRSQPPEIHP